MTMINDRVQATDNTDFDHIHHDDMHSAVNRYTSIN